LTVDETPEKSSPTESPEPKKSKGVKYFPLILGAFVL